MNTLMIESALLPVSTALSMVLSEVMDKAVDGLPVDKQAIDVKSITFNFRDESYSAEQGGFHPVEIMLTRTSVKLGSWQLAYVTTFAYIGNVYPELERNLDFDCQSGRCLVHPYIQWAPIKDNQDALELYQLWESNFMAYLNTGSYDHHQITLNDTLTIINGELSS